jgi:hypothetical protein
MRTLDEALETFILVPGTAGSESKKTACETSLLNWIWDGPDFTWGDDLPCASPLIRSLMISHNDSTSTTQEQRIEAVTLGMEGALDTWWIPAEVILSYYGDFTSEETPTHHERLVKMLKGVSAWKLGKVRRNLDGANLDGANLDGANLVRVSLDGASLIGASLIRASLIRANLDGASLVRANLDGASLDGANLVRASLDGASLNGANLVRANLVRASLNGASLNGASLNGVMFLGLTFHLDKTVGEPASLPDGWEFKSGLIVKTS